MNGKDESQEYMKTVAFVILHFADPEITHRCVRSILDMERQNAVRVVIVDNDVNKEHSERLLLKEHYRGCGNVVVLQNTGEGGFSRGNNIGYQYAVRQLKADFVVIANNDIDFVQKDFIARLFRVYREHPCHLIGPYIRNGKTGEPQNPLDVRLRTEKEAVFTIRMNRMAQKWFGLFYPLLAVWEKRAGKRAAIQKAQNREFYHTLQKQVVLYGACLICTPFFIRNEEYAFVPETAFFYEEYLLALRCFENNYQMIYAPLLKVMHEDSAATKQSTHSKKKKMRFMLKHTEASCEIYLREYRKSGRGLS